MSDRAGRPPRDAGMSLIEVLVGMTLFGILASLLLSLALSTQTVTATTRERTGVNEEARTAMERLTREVRQAAGLDAVTLPPVEGTAAPTSFTFWTDFDGDGARSNSAADPEVLTYDWNPATQILSLSAAGASSTTRPVLSAKVTSFVIKPRSSRWEYDTDGNGITTWQELDAAGAPVGNKNGTADPLELLRVDLLAVSMTVKDGDGTQTYHTQIDLRNRS